MDALSMAFGMLGYHPTTLTEKMSAQAKRANISGKLKRPSQYAHLDRKYKAAAMTIEMPPRTNRW
jgi:hypothetical protein